MRLLLFYGVYERERAMAHVCLSQLLDLLRDHTVDVVIQDDASPSRLGDKLADTIRRQVAGRVRVRRLLRSLGYHGTYERTLGFFDQVTRGNENFDYLVRVDPDVHFTSRKFERLFDGSRLPKTGMVGPKIQMRWQDLLLFYADLLPAGLRRRRRGELMGHDRELRRLRPVWWSDIGWEAVRRGFRGEMISGAVQVIAWRTLLHMQARGWLSRSRDQTGLIFQDDVLLSVFLYALGHPIRDLTSVEPTWSSELFLAQGATADEVRRRQLDVVHALKDEPWAQTLRQQIRI